MAKERAKTERATGVIGRGQDGYGYHRKKGSVGRREKKSEG